MKKPTATQNNQLKNGSNNHNSLDQHLTLQQEKDVGTTVEKKVRVYFGFLALLVSLLGLLSYSAIQDGSKRVTTSAILEKLVEDSNFMDLVGRNVPSLPRGIVVAITTKEDGTPQCPEGWAYLSEAEGRYLVTRKITTAQTASENALIGSQYAVDPNNKGINLRYLTENDERGQAPSVVLKNNGRCIYMGKDNSSNGDGDTLFIGLDLCMKR